MTAAAVTQLPLLGVLGGMGPQATADFLLKLVELTPAARDQEHIPVLTYTLPQVPDRNEAIMHGGESPLPVMQAGIRVLAGAGVRAIAIPCNTAHFWLDDLRATTDVPIVSIVDAVVRRLQHLGVRGKIALLATEATVKAGIYSREIEAAGVELVFPDEKDQAAIDASVKRVKAGDPIGAQLPVLRVLHHMVAFGASTAILGCTELPLLDLRDAPCILIDSTRSLAERCVEWSQQAGQPERHLIS